MATAVDICNMALSFLGDEATVTSIAPPEGSAQADHCARFYPIAKQELLSMKPWPFAMRRASLARLVAEPIGEETVHAYPVPADCAYVSGVYADQALRSEILRYTVESNGSQRLIMTEADSVWVRYVSLDTPESAFSPLFVSALTHRVASLIGGSVIPGGTGLDLAGKHLQLFNDFVQRAWAFEVRQQAVKEKYVNRFMGDAVVEVRDVYH